MEELFSYKYLGIGIHHMLNWNYNVEIIINGWRTAYCGLENKSKTEDLWLWNKKKLLFDTLVTHVIFYKREFWVFSISRKHWRRIEWIQKNFITYNLNITSNTPYLFVLIQVSLSPIEWMAMVRYLMYKNKINGYGWEEAPEYCFQFCHDQQELKWGLHAKPWLKH